MEGKVIWVALIAVAVTLLVLAGLNPPAELETSPIEAPVVVVPEQYPAIIEKTTPEIPEPKTPKVGEPVNVAPSFAELVPSQTRFFVNEIDVPPFSSSYYNYMPIKQHDIKSFAGAFGPYEKDPRQWIKVQLCAENYKVPQPAPACQPVEMTYSQGMVAFAVGLKYDEFIGSMAAKDYIAYYIVSSGDAKVAESEKAVIRTVKD
ncbi:hypothetical protein KY329_01875 [Candidatus Woesearchaeota archaeon]|nr:hypothetical protein [Candidatus Woesearchaeota archaeon]